MNDGQSQSASDDHGKADKHLLDHVLRSTLSDEQLSAEGIAAELQALPETTDSDEHIKTKSTSGEKINESSIDLRLSNAHLNSRAPSVLADELDAEQRYELQSLLGSGGMGKVYEFNDLNLQRSVAIKSLKNRETNDEKVLGAFIKEARITASLEHSGIVPVHDLDFTQSGEIYYSMRRVRGISLGQALTQASDHPQDMPKQIATINDRINVMLRVCDTLELAHRNNILHRDIKPENIMLGEFGAVYVVDWGTALILDGQEGEGKRVGTPIYMSPEQSRREPPAPVNEVYSLGATLFQMLLFRFPMLSSDLKQFWEFKKSGVIDPITAEERARIPSPLLAITLKALAEDVNERYQTVAEFAADLRDFQAGLAVSAFSDTSLGFLLRWYRRNKKMVHVFGVAMIPFILLLIIGASILSDMSAERARHWDLIFEDTFDRSDVGEHWSIDHGRADIIDGHLVITGQGNVEARLLIPHDPVVRFEFEAKVPEGHPICDMSAYMFTSPGVMDSWNEPSGYLFGFGVGNNSKSVLRRKGHMMKYREDVLIESGKWHHVICEKDVSSVSLIIDGQTIFSVDDHFPPRIAEEMFALIYTWSSTLHIKSVKLYNKTVAQRSKTIHIADEFFWEGLYTAAARLYGAVYQDHQGTELGAEALYRLALCRLAEDQKDEALLLLEELLNAKNASEMILSARLKIAEIYLLNGELDKGLELAKQTMQGVDFENNAEAMMFLDQVFNMMPKNKLALKIGDEAFIKGFDAFCEWWLQVCPNHYTISHGSFWYNWGKQHRHIGDWDGFRNILQRAIDSEDFNRSPDRFKELIFSIDWQGQWTDERLQASKQRGDEVFYIKTLVSMNKLDEAMSLVQNILEDENNPRHSTAAMIEKEIYEMRGQYKELEKVWGDNALTGKGRHSIALALLIAGKPQKALDILKPNLKRIESDRSDRNPIGDGKWRLALIAYRMLGDEESVQRILTVVAYFTEHREIKLRNRWNMYCVGSEAGAHEYASSIERTWSELSQKSVHYLLAEYEWINNDKEAAKIYYQKVMKKPYSVWAALSERRYKSLLKEE